MIKTVNSIIDGFVPNKNTLHIFLIFVILFFVTLKNNPIESALTVLTPLKLHEYHNYIAPFTPIEQEDEFGSKVYCKEAPAVLECFALYPLENLKNISLWYIISATMTGLITRFSTGGKDQ